MSEPVEDPDGIEPMRGTIGCLWRASVSVGRHSPAFLAELDGEWTPVGWQEAARQVDALAAGFLALGVKHGDCVAVLSGTRVEWTLIDLALSLIGAISVPIYPTASPADVEFIVGDCDVRLLIVETPRQLGRLRVGEALTRVDTMLIDAPRDGDQQTLEAVEERGRIALVERPGRVLEAERRVHTQDVLTYLYTSGTTGHPKACVLTHANFVAMVSAVLAIDGLVQADDSVLLFLPLAHNFARLMQYTCIGAGVPLAYCRDFGGVPAALVAVTPTLLPGVPRLYERVYAQVQTRFESIGRVRGGLALWGLGVGRRGSRCRQSGSALGPLLRVQLAIADRLVFRAVRARFGGRLRFGVSGGAALPLQVAEFFDALGITILEGYGLSEATCASHFNRPDRYRLGTVGLPLPGIQARLADDGEILLSGPTIFTGYRGDAAATDAVMTTDGWLLTGDVGVIDDDGFLRVVDRKKDLIVTSGGKNIAPQQLEQALTASPLVSQALVVGNGRPYLAALIAADSTEATRRGLDHATTLEGIAAVVKDVNASTGRSEQIKRHIVLAREFSQEDGEITATLKLRRHACEDHFREQIAALYDDRLAGA